LFAFDACGILASRLCRTQHTSVRVRACVRESLPPPLRSESLSRPTVLAAGDGQPQCHLSTAHLMSSSAVQSCPLLSASFITVLQVISGSAANTVLLLHSGCRALVINCGRQWWRRTEGLLLRNGVDNTMRGAPAAARGRRAFFSHAVFVHCVSRASPFVETPER
jgi:hypothetical protein